MARKGGEKGISDGRTTLKSLMPHSVSFLPRARAEKKGTNLLELLRRRHTRGEDPRSHFLRKKDTSFQDPPLHAKGRTDPILTKEGATGLE